MPSGRRIVKHTGILMMMELGIRLLDALVSVVLARYLAPHGFGLLAFALSFASLFSILPGFGMGSLINRDLSRDASARTRYVANSFFIKLLLAILTLTLIFGTSLGLQHSPEKKTVVMLAAFLMVLESNVDFSLSFFQAAQRVKTVALVNLAIRAGWVILSMVTVLLQGGVVHLLAVRVLLNAVGLAVSLLLIDRRLEPIKWSFDFPFALKILKSSFPFALFRLFGTVYTDIDTVMLSSMRGYVVTGWYAAGYKILRVFSFIPGSVFPVVLQALSKFSRESRPQMILTLSRGVKYLLMISLPIAGGTCILAPQIIFLLYGPAYEGAIPALRILIWSLVFIFLNSVLNASIAAVDQERKGSRILFYGALASGLSNLVVIPPFGHVGAAATTVLAESLIFVLQVRLLTRSLPGLNIWGQATRPFLATLLMMLVTWSIRTWNLIFIIPLAALVYLGSLVALRVVGREEWTFMAETFQRRFGR